MTSIVATITFKESLKDIPTVELNMFPCNLFTTQWFYVSLIDDINNAVK